MPPQQPDLRPSGAVHDSSLPQWAVAKMIKRRGGRRHAFADLSASRTALVVIDLAQNYIASTPCAAAIVAPINRLAAALRAGGGTVAWVLPAPMAEDPLLTAIWGEDHARRIASETQAHSPAAALAAGLERAADDLVVEKNAYSAFFPGRCPLPELLQARGVDTVLIAGVLTNICCESSARDAMTRGFRVVMVADANAARSDEEHQAALYNVMRNFGDVRTSADLVAAFGGGLTAASRTGAIG
jgi:nicotinamidase-related amidase